MDNFSRGGRGGGFKKDFRSGGGKGFGRGSDRGFDKDSQPRTMHSATCSDCGRACEVPFRPIGDRPVHCKDCFMKQNAMGGIQIGDRFQNRERREFSPSSSYNSIQGTPSRSATQIGVSNDEIKKQLEAINSKLERLITAVQNLSLM
ncbi:MAG: CxxC-x17-CxxC domain-containing protein [Candidatus Paceibacterota bacterium]|jgi:CxxC-x17-CxxC domain-containing protein